MVVQACVFGTESAIRPDSLQRAGAVLRRLLAMDVVDAEGLGDCAEGEGTDDKEHLTPASRNEMDETL